MKSKTLLTLATVLLLAANALAQTPRMFKNIPSLPALPAGFEPPKSAPYNPLRDAGVGDLMDGEKKYDVGKCFGTNSKVTAKLRYQWLAGGIQMVIDTQLKAPEDPAKPLSFGGKDEPAGKFAHHGGMLVFRKITSISSIGIDMTGECGKATLETYSANWIAVINGKTVSIELSGVPHAKSEAQGIVDALIGPLSNVIQNVK